QERGEPRRNLQRYSLRKQHCNRIESFCKPYCTRCASRTVSLEHRGMAGWKLCHRGRCRSGRWHAPLRGESDKHCGDSSFIRHIRSLDCVALSRLCQYRLCLLLVIIPSPYNDHSYNTTTF